jgi:REP element-mobilizing transposase RayT
VNVSKPARLPSVCAEQAYFVSTSADQKRFLFQSDVIANLFIDTLYFYRKQKKFLLHEFVLMPNHLHLIVTPTAITLERAMQFIKGGYSHQVRAELGKKLRFGSEGSPTGGFVIARNTMGFGITYTRTRWKQGWGVGPSSFGILQLVRATSWISLRLTSAAKAALDTDIFRHGWKPCPSRS